MNNYVCCSRLKNRVALANDVGFFWALKCLKQFGNKVYNVLIPATCRFNEAWAISRVVDKKDTWMELAKSALEHLDIDLGLYLYNSNYAYHVWLIDSYILAVTIGKYCSRIVKVIECD